MPRGRAGETKDGNGPPAGRSARRRERTRTKLLAAAHAVMARKGSGAVTIQEITNEADVGFGSFYNHFESKAAIIETMMSEAVESFGGALDRIADVVDDPAEILAASLRYGVRRAANDPDWGWFLVRTGLSPFHLRTGLSARLARDIRVGMEAGRLHVEDPEATFYAVAGTVLALMAARMDGSVEDEAPERAAILALNLLGIRNPEASEIAHRPLPAIEFPG
ncbi:MAG: TetR/AcrR family transcriptional regulator [bacterium]|nr:TetR/AcrR family transcriptional regulator [bacterium]